MTHTISPLENLLNHSLEVLTLEHSLSEDWVTGTHSSASWKTTGQPALEASGESSLGLFAKISSIYQAVKRGQNQDGARTHAHLHLHIAYIAMPG